MLLYKHLKGAFKALATQETWPLLSCSAPEEDLVRGWGGADAKATHFLHWRARPLWTSCTALPPWERGVGPGTLRVWGFI